MSTTSRPVGARADSGLFTPVRTRATLDNVVHQISDVIRSGVVREGDMLPSERVLATTMQVSRPTVRAAIQILVDAGVLEVRAGRSGGPVVVSIWVPPELTAVAHLGQGGDEIYRLLEARRVVEPRVAQLAALRGTEDHFQRMERSIKMLDLHRDDRARYQQSHDLFHRVMWQAADSPALEATLVDIFRRLAVERDSMLRTNDDIELGSELHRDTLRALRRGRPDDVEAEMHRHLEHFELLVEDVLGRGMTNRLPPYLRGPEDGGGTGA